MTIAADATRKPVSGAIGGGGGGAGVWDALGVGELVRWADGVDPVQATSASPRTTTSERRKRGKSGISRMIG